MNVLNYLYQNSLENPDKLALIANDGKLSYKELFGYALGAKKLLQSKGVKSGDKVVFKCHQNCAYAALMLGVQLNSSVMVPVEADISAKRLDEIRAEIGEFTFFDEYELSDFEVLKESEILEFKQSDIPSDDTFSEILYTTGTTGTPKGIMHTLKTQLCAVENCLSVVEIPANNRTLITCPMNHSFSIRRFYVSIASGTCAVFGSGVVPLSTFYKSLEKHEITACVFAPSALGIILNDKSFDIKSAFSRLAYIEFAGSYLQEHWVSECKELAPQMKIYNIFGSSEFGCATGLDESKSEKKGCIGKATKHTEVFILDNDFNELKDGERGYLALRGGSFMKGYVSGDSNVLIAPNGAYVTQDICYKENGNVYFIGRDSDVISVGALKVSPDEIEDIANTHPLVLKSACVGKPHKLAGAVPVLFVEVREGFDINEFYAFLRPKVESYEFPKEVIIIEQIPLTYNGKINRKELRARFKEI